jgi:hypothetical protein
VVKHLPSKCEALSSNASTKRRSGRGREQRWGGKREERGRGRAREGWGEERKKEKQLGVGGRRRGGGGEVREREREREKAGCRSLTPVILVTWEAEIRRIMFQSQNSTDLVYRLGIEGTFVTYQLCDPSFF